ncbi:hypothetical protein H072_11595 [Dactylellina haptotyla CBS 200.50]|uniref:Uncharacterized protein n=1 Tax=Dactylellina haptotyla (strain CBS 200.50) TaxID=1284197 RepID=S8B7Z2_DACHA|nr:hypothetical protein H072_11595 [Dactylellina haptotyla CBS 200.50]
MSASAASAQAYLNNASPPTPFYAESPETSRQLFKAVTTPSPRIKKRRRDSTRTKSPLSNESRSLHSSNSPPWIVEAPLRDDDIFAPKDKGKGKEPEPSSGFGLGLGISVLPKDSSVIEDGPFIAQRFSENSFVSPASPSPTESIDGDAVPVPPGDQSSIYTLTPGPAWPPPPSTDVSPEITPRNSLDAHNAEFIFQRRSDGSSEGMPLSPLTPAITQLLDEISTMDRPPSSNAPKQVTTVQAWVMDMPPMQAANKGRGEIRVRKMRSWRNLRALGTRTSQFELLRQVSEAQSMPSPPITPPGEGVSEAQEYEEEEEEEEQEGGQTSYIHAALRSTMPDSPVENPFYDDYEDIIEAHLSSLEPAMEEITEEPQTFLLDPSPEVERQFQDWPHEATGEQEREQESSRPAISLIDEYALLGTPPQPAPESPASQQGAFDPVTPDPNSDLVGEIEALLRSSPLRKEREAEAEEEEETTPTQAEMNTAIMDLVEDPESTPKQLQPPTFPGLHRSATEESLETVATNDTVFFTPTEAQTPFFEAANPTEPVPPIPIPTEVRPQTPPTKAVVATTGPSSTHSTPTRPPIPTRRSSLSHSRNVSAETIPTKSYPPTSHRPGAHTRGKSIDSSSVYNDRGRNYPPPAQRQRSSSANAVNDELARGRGRSRSIDDGPPQIPARKSSVGKTGRPTQLLESWLKKDSVAGSPRRPSLATVLNSNKASDESVERAGSHRFSFSSGVEILGVGEKIEVVNTGVVPSGTIKEVLVRTGSKGTKAAEFPEIAVSSPEPAKKPEFPTSPHHVPQFSFGEGPDLSFGEGSSASAGKGKGRAKDQTFTPLPVVFQLIPPTPAAMDEALQRNMQLGSQPIQIPATPTPEQAAGVPIRKATPNPLAGIPVVHSHSASDSIHSIPLPPRLPSVIHEIQGTRPATAPEPLIDFENTVPSFAQPRRPSLKNRPTGFKKSKLSPWWRPKYSYFNDQPYYGEYYEDEWRPHTTSGFVTTVTSSTDVSSSRRKKAPRTVNLGKVQLEFVGMKGLRESYRERKENKKRKKALKEFLNSPPVMFGQPQA